MVWHAIKCNGTWHAKVCWFKQPLCIDERGMVFSILFFFTAFILVFRIILLYCFYKSCRCLSNLNCFTLTLSWYYMLPIQRKPRIYVEGHNVIRCIHQWHLFVWWIVVSLTIKPHSHICFLHFIVYKSVRYFHCLNCLMVVFIN